MKEQKIAKPVPEGLGKALQIKQVVDGATANYALAFMQQTKLNPQEAQMIYGETRVGSASQFSIWFVKSENWQELQELRQLAALVNDGKIEEALKLTDDLEKRFPDFRKALNRGIE